jgi:hypothetical protein
MSTSSTTRLGLVKPDPGTGEPVNVAAQINASMDKIDAAVGATICTSTTRPSPPFNGQIIVETDTKRVYVYHQTTTTWLQLMVDAAEFLGSIMLTRPSSTNTILAAQASGDSQRRYVVNAAGTMSWGPGNAGQDVILQRTGANVLSVSGAIGVSTGYDYVTSSITGLGTSETVVLTVSSMVFKANTAYQVTMHGLVYGTTGERTHMRLRKTNTSGTDWGEFGRITHTGTTASLGMNFMSQLVLARTASTDLTANVVVTASASSGTANIFASASTPFYVRIEGIGAAASYPFAVAVS